MDIGAEISADELLDRLQAAGRRVTRDQLRRWHREGLIPRPSQKGLGRAQGSESFYPASVYAQASRVSALLGKGLAFERIGWSLWWEGFEVDERHWRPVLEKAARRLRQGRRVIRALLRLDERRRADTTIFDEVQKSQIRQTPLNLVIQLVSPSEIPALARLLAHI